MTRFALVSVLVACAPPPVLLPGPVKLAEEWPAACTGYDATTAHWTREGGFRGEYQEVLHLYATFKSPEWRCVHAQRDVETRRLAGQPREDAIAQAKAETTGPYEVELLVTTWDRKENDLDRGKRSVWRVVLVDEQGKEIAPLEIVKDKRAQGILHAEFPAYADFSTAYVAKFPHTEPLLGSSVKTLRLRMTSERGGVELTWAAP
jgi:hypothetical protein